MQLNHHNSNFIKKKFPVIVISDQITNAANIGSLFRICDAFGVEKLMLCGKNIVLGRKMTKTSRATEKVVNFEIHESASPIVEQLKIEKYQIISLEITNSSTPIHTYKIPVRKPIALILGDENFGVSEAILKNSDVVLHIDMFGNNSSMNVVQAANIALYEITKQLS